MKTRIRKAFLGPVLTMLLVAAVATASFAHSRISASALGATDNVVAPEVSEANGSLTAKFRIRVANEEDVTFSNVRVVFTGGVEVPVGDVAAGAAGVSEAQVIQFDTTNVPPTKSLAVQVTIKFLLNGTETSEPTTISFKRPE